MERPLNLPESLRQLALLEPLDGIWKDRLAAFAQEQAHPGGQTEGGLLAVPEWAVMTVPELAAIQNAKSSEEKLALLSPKARAVALHHRLGTRPTVFIAPGSVWPTKMWTETGFVESGRVYAAKGFTIVAMGSPDEKAICERIVAQVPGAISIAGETSLYDSAALFGSGQSTDLQRQRCHAYGRNGWSADRLGFWSHCSRVWLSAMAE